MQSLIRLGKLVREDKYSGKITKQQIQDSIFAEKGISQWESDMKADEPPKALGWARGFGGGTGIETGAAFESYDPKAFNDPFTDPEKSNPFMQTNAEMLGDMAFGGLT